MSESKSISEEMDELMDRLPDDAWTISHDPETDYRVATIVIDWRKVPGQTPLRAVSPPQPPCPRRSGPPASAS